MLDKSATWIATVFANRIHPNNEDASVKNALTQCKTNVFSGVKSRTFRAGQFWFCGDVLTASAHTD